LEHVNSSARIKDYRSYYDDVAAEIVGLVYNRDVYRFGYSFERPGAFDFRKDLRSDEKKIEMPSWGRFDS